MKPSWQAVLAGLPTVMLTRTLAGCQHASEGRVFAVAFRTMCHPFFVGLNQGMKKVVEARGDRVWRFREFKKASGVRAKRGGSC